MINVRKNITNIKNIYTFFEFEGYSSWEDFENILLVSVNRIGCQVIEKLDGIYSRHSILKKDGLIFKLMYHEDFGNCLCNQEKKDDDYYIKLNELAEEIASKLS